MTSVNDEVTDWIVSPPNKTGVKSNTIGKISVVSCVNCDGTNEAGVITAALEKNSKSRLRLAENTTSVALNHPWLGALNRRQFLCLLSRRLYRGLLSRNHLRQPLRFLIKDNAADQVDHPFRDVRIQQGNSPLVLPFRLANHQDRESTRDKGKYRASL
ncbi:MAG: hypothetical protein ACRESF_06910 [Pseudomonas sp.]